MGLCDHTIEADLGERSRGEDFKGYGLYDAAGALRAYAYARQFTADDEMELAVQDLAFSDASAGRALLGFFASFGTLSDAPSPRQAAMARAPR